jgi:hypothetical protein
VPGLAAGFVVRTGDKFVSSIVGRELGGSPGAYINEDVYVTATRTWLHPPLPFPVNLGWTATNASIDGIGGQATRFGGRVLGGLGIPLPGAIEDGDSSLRGILAAAADFKKPGRHSAGRTSARTDDARLRGAPNRETASALCLRHWHWAGGRKYRHSAIACRVAGAQSAGHSAPGEP